MRGPQRRPILDGARAEADRAAAVPATVPDLLGLALSAARDTALDAGLLAVVVGGDRPHCAVRDRHACQVIDQDPDPGRGLPRGHRIGLWVRYRPTDGSDPDGDAGGGGDGGGGLRRRLGPRPVTPTGIK